MDYLWSPWRFRYVAAAEPSSECVFCAIAQSKDDAKNFVLFRAGQNYLVLNRYPYSTGHLMIVPYQHTASLAELPEDAAEEMMRLMRRCERVLGEIYRPDGLNFGMNLGASAGAGVAGHIHMHAVPRWPGDANFMTTIAETRVLPEELETTYSKLHDICAHW